MLLQRGQLASKQASKHLLLLHNGLDETVAHIVSHRIKASRNLRRGFIVGTAGTAAAADIAVLYNAADALVSKDRQIDR